VFEGVTALDLVGPADAFAAALQGGPREPAKAAYEIVTIGLSASSVRSESGVAFKPSCVLDKAPVLDTLIIPGGSGLRVEPTYRKLSDWVRKRAPRLRRIAAVCTGIYGLAATGLLDGRRVTTHWQFAADVARRFPKLRVERDELFIKDGHFYTAAGVTSGIDLSLSLIEEDLGPARALAVARELVVYVKRPGGQEQFSEPLQFQTATPSQLGELAAHVATHLGRDLSVESLARKVGLSSRQLSRQCKEQLGQTPAAFVQRLRLDEARRRLTQAGGRVGLIAHSVGFKSADAFRRAFELRFGINPSAYRARFRASPGRG